MKVPTPSDLFLVALVTLLTTRPIRGQAWKYQPIGQGWQSDSAMEEEEDVHDFRFIPFNTLLRDGAIFPHEDLVSFVQMVVDEPRDQLLVGGRDRLYRLHLDNLRELQVSNWPSTDKRKNTCMQRGNREEECHNFIRVLTVSEKGEVFVCGTNAFHPNCSYRNATNFDDVKESKDGLGVCPYSPRYNATALRTENGDVYAATIIDSDASDAAISRRLGPSKNLRTLRRNSRWLEQPNFVSAYEIGNYVYFFFRETAQENINCGKVIFSRVARVCKYDDGGIGYLRDAWSTYQKARLNCSLPGEYPFYFDELQSTFYSEEEQRIYALFTTPTNSIAGSAVCVFNLTAIEHAFEGPFKYWESSSYAWLTSQESGSQRTCVRDSNGKRSTPKVQDYIMDTAKYQLMDRAVQSREGAPIIMRENERWTHVVVDHIVTKRYMVDMVFLATEEGKVRKMVRVPKTDQTCLVEEIKIVENGLHRPVKNMKLAGFKSAIYLSTPGYIVKVPVERCARHRSALECLNAQDPYCGWNSVTSTCETPPQGNVHSRHWDQNFSQCPVLDYPVNGRWSDWSEWEQCRQVGLDRMLDQSCLCRSRACDRPRPTNGGQECMGASMEVMNCTVHGQWTTWSAWGACVETCGLGYKARTRQCGNPEPRFGGNVCQGKDHETILCKDQPPCPVPPIDGYWTNWSGWTACDRGCNGGQQTRQRTCVPPQRGGQGCVGDETAWRRCNSRTCKEIAIPAPWTDWIVTNRTDSGYFQMRFRFECRAKVENSDLVKPSYTKTQTAFCLDEDAPENKYTRRRRTRRIAGTSGSDKSCYRPRELANTVTDIDTFSAVDRSLRKFCRKRRKLFKNYCQCRTLGVFLVCQKCGKG